MEEILSSVRATLWLIDFLCGQRWAYDSAMSDDATNVVRTRRAGIWVDPTFERPSGGAEERPVLADSASSTKPSEADIREHRDELANGQNGRVRISRTPNWPPFQVTKQG